MDEPGRYRRFPNATESSPFHGFLRCLGRGGCGALVADRGDDVAAHDAWHARIESGLAAEEARVKVTMGWMGVE